MSKIKKILLIFSSIAVIVIVFLIFNSKISIKNINSVSGKIKIVAAENFWGSLASQLGGNRVSVISLVTDPNANPHEYEVNSSDARAFAKANYVIVNGAGYDSWALTMLKANPSPSRKLLDVATLLGKKNGDNPHFWYNETYVNQVIMQMKNTFISLEPSQKVYFNNQYQLLRNKLAVYQDRLSSIKKKFAGIKVGATENIFVYLANSTGLDLISPPAFMQAEAEGTDPPASSVVTFQNQITTHQIKVLVYNTQTISPMTNNLKKLAIANHIPIVPISETIQPPNETFQNWMNNQLILLEKAL